MARTEENVGRLFKQPVVEHQLDGRRAPAGTPGAVKVRKLTIPAASSPTCSG